MHPVWSSLKARVGNRLARHLRPRPLRLNNKRPMVSFTFDDAPISAATTGADMLEEFDARGTYYVSGGLADTWSGNWTNAGAADIVRLHRKGHEIACHTYSHIRTTDVGAKAMAAEIERNRRYLQGLDASIESKTSPIRLASAHGCASNSSATRSVPRAASCPASTAEPWICCICARCR